MKVLTAHGADARVIAETAQALRDGKIIIYPTDTLYAFGCDALNARAVERLCRIKGLNPDKQLLSIVCADISEVSNYARVDNNAFRLLRRYLPGAFTFILPSVQNLPKVFRGRKSVGVRIPDNEFALALAAEFGKPIMSSSVHLPADADFYSLADAADPHSIAMNYEGNADIALTVDGGKSGLIGSTIIDLTESSAPELIRQGAGLWEEN